MSSKLATLFFLITALLTTTNCAQADAFPPVPTAPAYGSLFPPVATAPSMEVIPPSSPLNPTLATPVDSNAIGFAKQAGTIAGIAVACGQNITLFSNRVGEAVNKLAASPADKVLAMENFQSTMRRAQTIQSSKNTIPCAEVAKEFNSLPLLRDDYQSSVIAQLSPTMGAAANNAPTQANPTTNPAINNPLSNLPSNKPNPSQVQLNSGYPPPPSSTPNPPPSPIQQNAGYPPIGTTSPTSIPPSGMNQSNPTTQQYVDNKTPISPPNPNIYNSVETK